jgi:hypothetical protein
MARIRTVKPEFFSDEKLALASIPARYLFAGMLTEADDEGRLSASAKRLAGSLFPHDARIGPGRVTKWLKELEALNVVVRYEVNSAQYLWIRTFEKHQRISHPTPSRLPAPPEVLPNSSGPTLEVIGPELGTRNREQGKEQGTGNMIAPSNGARKHDPIFETLFMLETGLPYSAENRATMTQTEADALQKPAREIAATGITPADLLAAIGSWPQVFPDATCTPPAVAKHLGKLKAASKGMVARRSTEDQLIAEAIAMGERRRAREASR